MKSIKVIVFPKDSNPYQNLLYSHMDKHVSIMYLEGLTSSQTINILLFPIQLLLFRMRGYQIFHLHWVYKLTFPGTSYIAKLFSTIYYYLILTFIKISGYKLIWTVHNVIPHSKILTNDTKARRFLSKIASAKIIHSSATLEEMKNEHINIDNCYINPIGNYIDVYPNEISRKEARKKLKIDDHEFVFLFLGRIEPYKGIEKLVSVFSKLNQPKTKLIIAGKCSDITFSKVIARYKKLPNILIVDKYIPDNEIQTYFNGADVAVYPFDKVTTSSGVILALSFKRPVIYPKIGNLIDLPDNIGYAYDPSDPEGLKESLEAAINNKSNIDQLSSNAYTYVKKIDWRNIANTTTEIYNKLV